MQDFFDPILRVLDYLLHFHHHLNEFTVQYGMLVYALLFLIVFCETGLVIFPFLPGDSLIFAAGLIAANPQSGISFWFTAVVLLAAAILGDAANYWIGRRFGAWAIRNFPRIIRPGHLAKTARFFERYGGKTIIIARFVPVVRSFGPFVAGTGAMEYRRFTYYNIAGALLWIGLILPIGWYSAHIPAVRHNFKYALLAIFAVALLPSLIRFLRRKLRGRGASGPAAHEP